MTNRREFVRNGLTLSAVASAGLPAAAAAGTAATIRLAGFVYDSRFAEAREVAGHAARHGAKLWEISGDLFDLWSDHLDPLWRQAPQAVAGVTTAADLFVLQDMAADRRMQVVYRGEHGAVRDGTASHSLTGPEAMFAQAALDQNPDLWAPLLGRAMVDCPAGLAPVATLWLNAPARTARDEALHSWIIAPRTSRATA